MLSRLYHKQNRRQIALLLGLLALGFGLTACGKKPGHVDPPLGTDAKHDPFPEAYPDPSTDPKPESQQ